MRIDEQDALTRQFELDTVFRPSAPVDQRELFAGREEQMWSVLEAARSPGQHAVIYGERGVGKTSLASVAARHMTADGRVALRIDCDSSDNFASLWQKFVDECQLWLASIRDVDPALRDAMYRATEVLNNDEIGPGQVRVALRHITAVSGDLVVFFDEVDQLLSVESTELLANTIKSLSDRIEPVTFVLLGVADTVDELISGHESIRRNLVQVGMPRMKAVELREIAETGLGKLQMSAGADALSFICTVPRGLPHYAHLLTQEGARQALINHDTHISMENLIEGLRIGLDKVDHTLSASYAEAVYSPQPSRFKEVLLACALARVDEHGFFRPAALRDPYSAIIGKQQEIPNFNPQLVALASGHGEVLTRSGRKQAWRYRFKDPLMEPFVLLKGLDAGMVTPQEIVEKGHPYDPEAPPLPFL